ncbi:AraC family transcriptional regulator [Roseibium algae]|uniref:Helix-turn-helix domain-containing protein n=1 Tax=Roseibium algae TaxID=3123038 RepID=A0ABU8TGR2_9HYPH
MKKSAEWARSEIVKGLQLALPKGAFDWPAFAARYGYDTRVIDDPEGVLSIEAVHAAFEHAAQVMNDDAAMLDVFYNMKLGQFTLFDYLFVCAPSIRDGCMAWQRFMPMRNSVTLMVFNEHEDGGSIEWKTPPHREQPVQFTFARIGWAIRRVETALGISPAPVRIELASPKPKTPSNFLNIYRNNIAFEQSGNRILFTKQQLATAPQKNDCNLYSIIQKAAIEELDLFARRDSPLFLIADEISETMKTGTCSLAQVSANLSMSQRSVQRLLTEEGTSFRSMMEDIRRAAANRYLKETNLPMKEIAFLLGFSEISTFSRAVKTWFGSPPKEIRRTLREDEFVTPASRASI